jgi:hypothetical protein
MFPTEWAARVLPGGQTQRVLIQRGLHPLSPFGSVVGQGRVVGGRRALDHDVPVDPGTGECNQVAAADTAACPSNAAHGQESS